jgi:hypothetical protein
MTGLCELVSGRQMLTAGILVVTASIYPVYIWLKPKPLVGFPHNPISSILGDIPEIARVIEGGGTLSEYYMLLMERHGPIVQV